MSSEKTEDQTPEWDKYGFIGGCLNPDCRENECPEPRECQPFADESEETSP